MSTTSQSDRLPLMDLAAVAERLGVNQHHVRRLVAERRIPFVKWGHLSASTHGDRGLAGRGPGEVRGPFGSTRPVRGAVPGVGYSISAVGEPIVSRPHRLRVDRGWYNARRRHSSIGDLSPIDYEACNTSAAPAR